jgi:hypothetical protein
MSKARHPNASEYLTELFQSADTIALLLINKTTSAVVQRIGLAHRFAQHRWQAWLRYMNAATFEVYAAMNALIPNAPTRDKAQIQAIRTIYLDFDQNGPEALNRLRSRSDVPSPNYILNTSPNKYQVVWRVASFTIPAAESLLHGLARDTGADIAATDASRVLRLPGFRNHKYMPSHLVTAEAFHSEVFTPTDFPHFIATATQSPASLCDFTADPAHVGTDNSPSGRDWRYALRRLRRGIDPATLIAELTTLARNRHKPKPGSYAARTVARAKALIDSSPIRQGR